MLGADKEGGNALGFVVVGHLCFGVRQEQGRVTVSEKLEGMGGHGKGNGKHLRGFVRSVAEHHALIPGTEVVHAEGDVPALPGDMGVDLVTADMGQTDAGQNF